MTHAEWVATWNQVDAADLDAVESVLDQARAADAPRTDAERHERDVVVTALERRLVAAGRAVDRAPSEADRAREREVQDLVEADLLGLA